MTSSRWKRASPVNMYSNEAVLMCSSQEENTSIDWAYSRLNSNTVVIFSAYITYNFCRSAPIFTSKPYSYCGWANTKAEK
jgi:hypothetical protein